MNNESLPIVSKETQPTVQQTLSTADARQKLFQLVSTKRPVLDEILCKHGNSTLAEYCGLFANYSPHSEFAAERQAIAQIVYNETVALFDQPKAEAVAQSLYESPVINTGDHHGPLTHPILVGGNLLFALPYILNRDVNKELITLSFGNVPLNNTTYPRGLLLSDKDGDDSVKIPLFGDKQKQSSVCTLNNVLPDRQQTVDDQLRKLIKRGVISESKAGVIRRLVSLVTTDTVSATYAQQVTKMNNVIWAGMFAEVAPKLTTLQVETLVMKRLEQLLDMRDPMITGLIEDFTLRNDIKQSFDGVPGAWSQKENSGSFLFWGTDNKGRLVQLQENNGALVGDGTEIRLTATGISEAIEQKKIVPTMFMSFYILAFRSGFKCYGGFMQTDYLTTMQECWEKVLSKHDTTALERVRSVPTKNFCVGPGTFFTEKNGILDAATGIDLLDRPLSYNEIRALSATTLKNIFAPSLPIMYATIYGASANPELTQVSQNDLIRENLAALILSK